MNTPSTSVFHLPQTLSEQDFIEPSIQSPSSFRYLANGTSKYCATLTIRAACLEECQEMDRILTLLIQRAPEQLIALLRYPGLRGTPLPGIMIDAPQRRYRKKAHAFMSPWRAELRQGLNIHDKSTLLASAELKTPPDRIALCISRLLKELRREVALRLDSSKP